MRVAAAAQALDDVSLEQPPRPANLRARYCELCEGCLRSDEPLVDSSFRARAGHLSATLVPCATFVCRLRRDIEDDGVEEGRSAG